ncbi:hypothetical protein [Lacticaseibacillus sp. 866-1]|uniref:hypothetical protein n=1 Tax=Lacticaseibacillus sp. 866-1 TaxID=2799576 RepID=UPI001942297C|nr:hypothetical protein [Lacticaseibacillus sp. 866-1]
MNENLDDIDNQYHRLLALMPKKIDLDDQDLELLLGKLIFIKSILSRVETRRLFKEKHLSESFSFLLESFASLVSGEVNGSKLLLRVSIDCMIKFLVVHASGKVDEHHFSTNLHTYYQSAEYLSLKNSTICNIDVFLGQLNSAYDHFSVLTHNINTASADLSSFFSQIFQVNSSAEYLLEFNDIVTNYCSLLLVLSLSSVQRWENADRIETLKLAFGNNKVARLNAIIQSMT